MAHLLCIGWVQVGGAWAFCVCSISIWIRSFLAFMPFLLPPCLFDSIICFGPFGGCLTLVAGRTYGLLGSCPLPFHSFPGWALLGWRPSPSYLAHVLFFPVSVGLLAGDPTRPLCCFCYIITSLSFIFYYPCAYGLILLPCQSTFHIFTSFGFCWPTFNCASTIHSSGFLVPFTSFLPLLLSWAIC